MVCKFVIFNFIFLQASVGDFCKYLGVTSEEAEQLIKKSVSLARDACNEFWEKQQKTSSTLVKYIFSFVREC